MAALNYEITISIKKTIALKIFAFLSKHISYKKLIYIFMLLDNFTAVKIYQDEKLSSVIKFKDIRV